MRGSGVRMLFAAPFPHGSLNEQHRALVTFRRLREFLVSCYEQQILGERCGKMQAIEGAQRAMPRRDQLTCSEEMFAREGHATVKALRDMRAEEVKNCAHLALRQFFESPFSRQ
jgi:hypothetical protein